MKRKLLISVSLILNSPIFCLFHTYTFFGLLMGNIIGFSLLPKYWGGRKWPQNKLFVSCCYNKEDLSFSFYKLPLLQPCCDVIFLFGQFQRLNNDFTKFISILESITFYHKKNMQMGILKWNQLALPGKSLYRHFLCCSIHPETFNLSAKKSSLNLMIPFGSAVVELSNLL